MPPQLGCNVTEVGVDLRFPLLGPDPAVVAAQSFDEGRVVVRVHDDGDLGVEPLGDGLRSEHRASLLLDEAADVLPVEPGSHLGTVVRRWGETDGVAFRCQRRGWLRSATVTQTVDVSFMWCPRPVPQGIPVVQVYGWLLDDAGRVLVQNTRDRFNLPGGSPESGDADLAATVIREAMEESQVTVTEVVYLGYEQVQRAGRPHALVRTVGKVGEFHPRRPDPDGGRLFRRLMTSLAEAPGLLEWGCSGLAQARAATRIAEGWWGLPAGSPTLASCYVD